MKGHFSSPTVEGTPQVAIVAALQYANRKLLECKYQRLKLLHSSPPPFTLAPLSFKFIWLKPLKKLNSRGECTIQTIYLSKINLNIGTASQRKKLVYQYSRFRFCLSDSNRI